MPRKKQEKGKLTSKEASVLDMPAKIGQILKEKHGVHKISVLGKKITRILSDHKVQYPNDSHFINKKIENIKSHYAKNKQDKKAEREIVRYLSLKKKLENYSL